MADFAKENGYVIDITENRYHHEIYLTDPRRTEISKLKTVVRRFRFDGSIKARLDLDVYL